MAAELEPSERMLRMSQNDSQNKNDKEEENKKEHECWKEWTHFEDKTKKKLRQNTADQCTSTACHNFALKLLNIFALHFFLTLFVFIALRI